MKETPLGDRRPDSSPTASARGSFWDVFEHSRVPMALVDANRQVVAVNDAALEPFGYSRAEVIGTVAGSTLVDEEPSLADGPWEQLLRTNAMYAQRVVRHRGGRPMRVSYAGHGMTIADEWVALIVTLSARFEPDGANLIGTEAGEAPVSLGAGLTRREREIVRMIALGANTTRIAAALYLSPATVRTHVKNAMQKTSARTRAHLVAIVMCEGLVDER